MTTIINISLFLPIEYYSFKKQPSIIFIQDFLIINKTKQMKKKQIIYKLQTPKIIIIKLI